MLKSITKKKRFIQLAGAYVIAIKNWTGKQVYPLTD